jgi:hypothetical protein
MSIKKERTADFESAVHSQFLAFHSSLRIKLRLNFLCFGVQRLATPPIELWII